MDFVVRCYREKVRVKIEEGHRRKSRTVQRYGLLEAVNDEDVPGVEIPVNLNVVHSVGYLREGGRLRERNRENRVCRGCARHNYRGCALGKERTVEAVNRGISRFRGRLSRCVSGPNVLVRQGNPRECKVINERVKLVITVAVTPDKEVGRFNQRKRLAQFRTRS